MQREQAGGGEQLSAIPSARAAPLPENDRPVRPGLEGGRYKPLSDADVLKIHNAALDVLEQIGMADAIPSGIEVMTKQKKAPPIGYRPFANVLIQKSQYELAEQVILKVPEVDYQITMLQYIESYMKAAEVAVRAKMTEVLPEILQKTTDPAVREYIEGVLAGGR